MPKVRKPVTNKPPTPDEIESFAAGAETTAIAKTQNQDPTAPRSFKAIKLGLNQYEFEILEKASLQAGRSKLNFIRHAILEMAKDMESK